MEYGKWYIAVVVSDLPFFKAGRNVFIKRVPNPESVIIFCSGVSQTISLTEAQFHLRSKRTTDNKCVLANQELIEYGYKNIVF